MKQVPQISAEAAASKVKDGDTIFGGGFGMIGSTVHLLHALAKTAVKNLIYTGNNLGEQNLGWLKIVGEWPGKKNNWFIFYRQF